MLLLREQITPSPALDGPAFVATSDSWAGNCLAVDHAISGTRSVIPDLSDYGLLEMRHGVGPGVRKKALSFPSSSSSSSSFPTLPPVINVL